MDFQGKVYISNPRETANIFSRTFFFWILPFLKKGNQQTLKLDDLYNVLKEDESEELGNRLEKEWEKQCAKAREKDKQPSLIRSLGGMKEARFYVWIAVCLMLNECTLKIAQPIFLRWLVKSFTDPKFSTRQEQYLFATGLCLSTLFYIIVFHTCMFNVFHTALKARISLSSLIYWKSLRLSRSAQTETNVGQAINLLSSDMSRYESALQFIPYLIGGPVQLGIFTYLLWQELGVSSLAGIGFIILLLPLQYLVGKYSTIIRLRVARKTDARVGFMNEIITAMRVIKMYAWEKPFSNLINKLRKLEVNALTQKAYLQAFYMSLYHASAKLIIVFTIVAYIFVSGNTLEADKIFFTVTIFNTLLYMLLFALPTGAAGVGAILVSMRRIRTYLLLTEQQYNNNIEVVPVSHGIDNEIPTEGPRIAMKSVSASWCINRITLSDLNIDIMGNKLIMVVGSVGSGKSSFLNTLIAELPITSGQCTVLGKTAYASQEPWIFSGNIKQNITFGKELNQNRYNHVLSVCALEEDMRQWPYRDLTDVGERGVSLSGGQKARVNLARALYQEADIYLLDDPLSAVDTRVSRHIFEKCVQLHLKNKLRILVTHQLQYLPSADHIILLENGNILAQGTYAELVVQNIDFLSLINVDSSESHHRKSSFFSSPGNIKIHPNLPDGFDENDKPKAQVEQMSVGGVSMNTYWAYFKSSGSVLITILIGLTFVLAQLLLSACEYWLSYWTSNAEEYAKGYIQEFDQDTYLLVYSCLVAATTVVILINTLSFFKYAMTISVNVHDTMFKSLVRAPTKFFDDNPSGRIMNRFTKDLSSLDELLPDTIYDATQIFLQGIGILVIVCFTNYYVLLPTFIVLAAFFYTRKYYMGASRSVKRVESLTRSPIFTHLTASLQGLATIRSSGAQSILTQQFGLLQDSNSSAYFLFLSTSRWLGVWLEMISVIYLTIIAFSFLLLSTCKGKQIKLVYNNIRYYMATISSKTFFIVLLGNAGLTLLASVSGNVGLALSSAMLLNMNLQWGVRQSAETENNMISVERMLEYSKVNPEAPLNSTPDKQPIKTWPSEGKIKFCCVSLSYGERDVLKEVTFGIKKSEKIGIVGRTGAGKSSIIAALFRLTEPRGDIFIDGIRINDIGLHDVRQNISIIPQEPVLFSGTMRYNLDPFDQFTDEELWTALAEVEMKDAVPALDFHVTDAGGNFSVGQRQLVCLARAILRKNKIIVLDEATANVDPRTDEFIQRTILAKFSECSIITIAHRLQSVMDCDRILVLNNGYLMEYDRPHLLLQNPNGYLTSMIKQAGQTARLRMQQIALETYNGRRKSFQADIFEDFVETHELE